MIYTVFIVIGISIVAILIFIRLFLFFRDIRNITGALEELNNGKSRKRLTTSSGNKHIEALCASINKSIALQEQYQVNIKNYEQRLRNAIANTSHDLRTPLTAILGYISMIKTDHEKAPHYLNIIEGRANALHCLIEEFYELSVIDDENYNIKLERVDISAIATNCILGYYEPLESKKIKIDVNLPEEALFVIGNTLALERIFQNLIQNSIKFASNSIYIKLEEQNACCVFTISNNTKTLTSADITHLFDRFYTADKSRSEGNTGLGLYIVKILLERIHGTIIETSLQKEWFTIKIAFNKEYPLPGFN